MTPARLFTPGDVLEAVKRANDLPVPLTQDPALILIVEAAIEPAVAALPPHHDCEVVREALKTVYVMGIDTGVSLERGR